MSFYINQKSEIAVDTAKEQEPETGYIVGYASKFNGVDSYDDTIEMTAYNNFLSTGKMPKMFFNHNSYDMPVGVWDKLEVDEVGLKAYGRLNLKMTAGAELYEAIKFGSVDGLSICIRLAENDYFYDDKLIRHITNVQDMREISIVNFPADSGARMVDFKSVKDENINSIKEFERNLRDAGCSKSDAMTLISMAKRVLLKAEQSERDAAQVKQLSDIKAICKNILENK